MTKTKTLWHSKTFWLNTMALAGVVVQHFTGLSIDPATQVSVLAGINIMLRLITSTGIE